MRCVRSTLPILVVILAGCSGLAPTSKVYAREDFRKEFLGATLDEVRSKLGAPDSTNIAESTWTYKKRTKSAKTGKIDDFVTLQHIEGRIADIALEKE